MINIKAILYALLFTVKRHKSATAVTAVILYMVAYILWAMMNPPQTVETPEQFHARQDAQSRVEVAEAERKRSLCHVKSVCAKYGSARQECATAGNFDHCISVKVGDRDSSLITQCTNDGHLRYSSDDLPNAVVCFLIDFP
jgi:hypothetical protein